MQLHAHESKYADGYRFGNRFIAIRTLTRFRERRKRRMKQHMAGFFARALRQNRDEERRGSGSFGSAKQLDQSRRIELLDSFERAGLGWFWATDLFIPYRFRQGGLECGKRDRTVADRPVLIRAVGRARWRRTPARFSVECAKLDYSPSGQACRRSRGNLVGDRGKAGVRRERQFCGISR